MPMTGEPAVVGLQKAEVSRLKTLLDTYSTHLDEIERHLESLEGTACNLSGPPQDKQAIKEAKPSRSGHLGVFEDLNDRLCEIKHRVVWCANHFQDEVF